MSVDSTSLVFAIHNRSADHPEFRMYSRVIAGNAVSKLNIGNRRRIYSILDSTVWYRLRTSKFCCAWNQMSC